MRTIEKLLSDGFYLTLNLATQTILGYFFWIILAKMLVPHEVGTYSSIFNLASFLISITTFGLLPTTVKLISDYSAKQQISAIKAVIYWTTKNMLIIHTALSVGLFILAPFIYSYTPFSAMQIQAFAFVIFAVFLAYFSSNYLYALRQMKHLFLSETASLTLKLLLTVLLVGYGFSYYGAFAALIISALAISAFRLRWIPIKKGKFNRRAVWYYAKPAFIGSIGASIMNHISFVSLTALGTMTAVGLFTIAFTFSIPVRLLPPLIAQTLMPTITRQWALKQNNTLNLTLMRAFKYSYFVALPTMLIFVIFAKELVLLFANIEYIEAVLPLQIMALAYLFFSMIQLFNGILYYIGKPDLHQKISTTAGVMALITSFLLVPYFGALGAALAFFLTSLAIFAISLLLSRRHLGFLMPTKEFLKTGAAILLATAVLFLIKAYVATSVFGMFASMFVFGLVYLAVLLCTHFFDKTDIEAMRIFQGKAPKTLREILEKPICFLRLFA